MNIDSVITGFEPYFGAMSLYAPHHYPGKLIVVEGVDASGRTRQFNMLKDWLEANGVPILFTDWKTPSSAQKSLEQVDSSAQILPVSFSILNASDFADRLANIVVPALKVGIPVLMDGYCYSAFATDSVRGVDKDWIRNLYQFALRPDAIFYFRLTGEECMAQRSQNGASGYFECGMDLDLSDDPGESYRLFQTLQIAEYETMIPEFAFHTVSAAEPLENQQEVLRSAFMEVITN